MTAPIPQPGADPGLPNAPGQPTATDGARRSLLRAAPALLAPTVLAPPALAAAATPLFAIFREWEALQAFWNDRDRDFSEAESNDVYAQLTALEDRILAEPVTGLADLAAKVVVGTTYGDFVPEKAVVAECEALLAAVLT